MFRKYLNITAFLFCLIAVGVFSYELLHRNSARNPASEQKIKEQAGDDSILNQMPRAKLLSYVGNLWQQLLISTNYRFDYRNDTDRVNKESEAKPLLSSSLLREYQGAKDLWAKAHLKLDSGDEIDLNVQINLAEIDDKTRVQELQKGETKYFIPIVKFQISTKGGAYYTRYGARSGESTFFPQDKQLYYVSWLNRGISFSSRYPKIALQVKLFNQSTANVEILDVVSGRWILYKDALEWRAGLEK